MSRNEFEAGVVRYLRDRIDDCDIIYAAHFESIREIGAPPDFLHGRVATSEFDTYLDIIMVRLASDSERDEISQELQTLSAICTKLSNKNYETTHLLLPIAYYLDEEDSCVYFVYQATQIAALHDVFNQLNSNIYIDGVEPHPHKRLRLASNFAIQIGSALDALISENCQLDDFSEFSVLIDSEGNFYLRVDETCRPHEEEMKYLEQVRVFFELCIQVLISRKSQIKSELSTLAITLLFEQDEIEGDNDYYEGVLEYFSGLIEEGLNQSADITYVEMRDSLEEQGLDVLSQYMEYERLIKFAHILDSVREELGEDVSQMIVDQMRLAFEGAPDFSFEDFGRRLAANLSL